MVRGVPAIDGPGDEATERGRGLKCASRSLAGDGGKQPSNAGEEQQASRPAITRRQGEPTSGSRLISSLYISNLKVEV